MLCHMLVDGQSVARTMIHVLNPRVAHVRYVSRPGPSRPSVMIVILYLTQFTRLTKFSRLRVQR